MIVLAYFGLRVKVRVLGALLALVILHTIERVVLWAPTLSPFSFYAFFQFHIPNLIIPTFLALCCDEIVYRPIIRTLNLHAFLLPNIPFLIYQWLSRYWAGMPACIIL